MNVTVEAVYENGTLKLKESLPFKEHEHVEVTIRPLQQASGNAGALPYASDRGVWAGMMPDSAFCRAHQQLTIGVDLAFGSEVGDASQTKWSPEPSSRRKHGERSEPCA